MNTVLTYITPSTNVIWERSKKPGNNVKDAERVHYLVLLG